MLTVSDVSGNTAQCDFDITVTDNTPPEITCPPDIVICDESEPTGTATATDNCSTPTVTSSDSTNGVAASIGAGGSLSGSLVLDNEGARLNIDLVNVETLAPGTYTVDQFTYHADAGSGDGFIRPFIVKDLGGGSWETLWVGSQVPITSSGVGSLALGGANTLTVGAACDVYSGVYHALGARVFLLNASGSTDHDGTPVEPTAVGQVISGISNPGLGRTYASGLDLSLPGTKIVRTWTATDDAGNSSSCEQCITIQDVAPTLVCGPDVTLECDAEPAPPTVSDDCSDVADITVTFNDVEVNVAPTAIGAGGSLPGAGSLDTANGTRLNIDLVNIQTLPPGTYAVNELTYNADAGGGAGFIRPFLAKDLGGGSYETLWVGPQVPITLSGVGNVVYGGGETFTLAVDCDVFSGIYHTGGARMFFAGGGSSDHDGTPVEPTTVGQVISGISNPNLG
ncbi:MAG: hypothetical protein AAF492_23855, partial [Verrucomicrobiota bacterium]